MIKPVFYIASSLLVLAQSVTLGVVIWVTVRRNKRTLSVSGGGQPSLPMCALATYSFGPQARPPPWSGNGQTTFWFTDRASHNHITTHGWRVIATPLLLPVPGLSAAQRTAAYTKWVLARSALTPYFPCVVTLDSRAKPRALPPQLHRDTAVYYLPGKVVKPLDTGRVRRWVQYVHENTSPAWWNRLLVADTSMLVHNTRVPCTSCSTLLQLMDTWGVTDEHVFGFMFSPLSTHALPVGTSA